MVYQFHSLNLTKSRTIPSFATPAASCPLAGLPGFGELQPSKLVRVSSAQYYTVGENRLYRPTRLARRRPSSLPLRPSRHFRHVVPLRCCCCGDGYGEVHSYRVERRESLLPGRRLCPFRGQNGRTLVRLVAKFVCVCFVCALDPSSANSAQTPLATANIGFAVDTTCNGAWTVLLLASWLECGWGHASNHDLFTI